MAITEDLCGCWRQHSLPGLWKPQKTQGRLRHPVHYNSNMLSERLSVCRTFFCHPTSALCQAVSEGAALSVKDERVSLRKVRV